MRAAICAMGLMTVLCLPLARPLAAEEKVPPPQGDAQIVSPDARLELLYTRTADIKGGLTEGPAVAPDGSVYFSDIPLGVDKGLIVRFDPATKKISIFTDDSGKANGLIFNAQGYLIACEGSDYGGRRVSQWNVKTKERTTLADKYQGKKFNAPNDVCVDRQGRIYFTDPRYLGDEPRELKYRAVYRIDTEGKVVEVTHDVEKPNGIALSPDGKTLYVADHNNGTDKIDPTQPPPKEGAMKIYAFPLGGDGLVSGNRKTLIDFGEEKGCDGMTIDEQGNLYLTVRSNKRPGVRIFSPDGKEIASIPTGPTDQPDDKPPVGLPSNVEFGIGPEANVLYVTVDMSLYRIPLKARGYHVQYQAKK